MHTDASFGLSHCKTDGRCPHFGSNCMFAGKRVCLTHHVMSREYLAGYSSNIDPVAEWAGAVDVLVDVQTFHAVRGGAGSAREQVGGDASLRGSAHLRGCF